MPIVKLLCLKKAHRNCTIQERSKGRIGEKETKGKRKGGRWEADQGFAYGKVGLFLRQKARKKAAKGSIIGANMAVFRRFIEYFRGVIFVSIR